MRKIKLFLPLMLVLLCATLLFGTLAAPKQAAPSEFYNVTVPSFDAEPTVTESGDTVSVDLTEFTTFVVQDRTTAYENYAGLLADRIEQITGVKLNRAQTESGAKRICVYPNDAAMEKLGGDCGWTVQVIGKHIYIAGSNPVLALMGVQYFMDTYLGEDADAFLEMKKEHTVTYAEEDTIHLYSYGTRLIARKNVYTLTTVTKDGEVISSTKDPISTNVESKSFGLAGINETFEGFVDPDGNPLTLPTDITVQNGVINYLPVYDPSLLLNETDSNDEDHISTADPGEYEMQSTLVKDRADAIAEGLSSSTGLAVSSSLTDNGNSILLGTTSYDYLSTNNIRKDQYVVAVRDGDIVATGWSLETQYQAAVLIDSLLSDCSSDLQKISIATEDRVTYTKKVEAAAPVTAEDGSVTTVETVTELIPTEWKNYKPCVIPKDFSIVTTTNDNWVPENAHPLPSGVTLDVVADVENGSLLYVYSEENAATVATAFADYCAALEAAGYSLVTESTLSGSTFRTYANYMDGITLYVSHNVFEAYHNRGDGYLVHEGEQLGTGLDSLAEKYFTYTDPQIRVVSAKLTSVTMPTDELLATEKEYTKITESTLTTFDATIAKNKNGWISSVGVGYALILEDGRFILMDSMNSYGDTLTGEDAYTGDDKDPLAEVNSIWKALTDLFQYAHGRPFDSANGDKIEIAAWFLSHTHGDHINAARYLIEEYKDQLTLDYFVMNILSDRVLYDTSERQSVSSANDNMAAIRAARPEVKIIKIHTGETLYIGNVKVEALYTPDQLLPQQTVIFNDTSLILRFTIYSTAALTNDADAERTIDYADTSALNDTTFTFTGDAYIYTGRWLCAMYGEDLDTDMVTIAHHGNNGLETTPYKFFKAETVWWTNSISSAYDSYLDSGTWKGRSDQYAVFVMRPQYLYIPDNYNVTVKFTYDENGVLKHELMAVGDANRDGVSDLATALTHNECAMPTAYYQSGDTSTYSDFFGSRSPAVKRKR